ncbi:MAG TPA: RagB/SusD family nutrient uptake outer membrane protein [Gemmatimonadaceae bacterium]|nr:RagB/SusD family nutrient uptake outer membrane protein [Gemmatimonadaceae bacterium]
MKVTRTASILGSRIGGARQWLTVVALSVPLLDCNLLNKGLETTAPDKIETSTLEVPANATLIVNSAIGAFECALGSYIVDAGMASGELMDATPTAANWAFDRRDTDPSADTRYATNQCDAYGLYTPIQVARGMADRALELLQGWTDAQVPDRQDLIAKSAAYAGYSRILLGEGFCEAAINLGPKLTSNEVFASAESMFTTAITAAQAAGDAQMLNMAYVGRARARLDQGNKAGAAADAALVTPGFVQYASAEVAPSTRQNRVADFNIGGAITIAPAYRDLTVTDANGNQVPDTRVVDTTAKTSSGAPRAGNDNRTPWYIQTKYPSTATPIPIASYKEARLIIAEVQGGQQAVDIINALRASHGLPAFSSSDPNAIANQVIEERSRELFLEGQHFYDVRRLNLPLVPAAGIAYSTVYLKGGTYGSERCFPLPDVETLNNPNI